MNRSFWLGLVLGAAATAGVFTWLSASEAPRETPRSPEASASPARPAALYPGKPEAESSDVQKEVDHWKKACQEAKLETVALRHAMTVAGIEKEKVDAVLKAERENPERLKGLVAVGADLHDDVASALNLNESQRMALNFLLKQEAQEMYAALRKLGAEDPSIELPAEDGPKLFGVLNAKAGESRPVRKTLPEGTKPRSFAELYGPESLYGRLFDALLDARRKTLASTRSILDPSQQEKMSALFKGNFLFEGPGGRWQNTFGNTIQD